MPANDSTEALEAKRVKAFRSLHQKRGNEVQIHVSNGFNERYHPGAARRQSAGQAQDTPCTPNLSRPSLAWPGLAQSSPRTSPAAVYEDGRT